MDGKLISWSLYWRWFQAQTHSESSGIVRGSWHPESVPVLRHRNLAFGPCIFVEPIRGATRRVLHDLNPLLAAATDIIRLLVWLRFILSRTVVAVHRFVKPQLV